MKENSYSRPGPSVDWAFVELTLEMADIGLRTSNEGIERADAADTVLKEAVEIRKGFES